MTKKGTKKQMKIDNLLLMRSPIIDKCEGCKKIEFDAQVGEVDKPITINACSVYIDPEMKWRLGDCNMATHKVIEETKKAGYKPGKFGKKRRNR